jgi:hypothetical protein
MNVEGLNTVFTQHPRLRARAQHQRHIGTINVGVKEPCFVAELGKSEGEIHGQRGFADASLAGTDGDDGVNSRQGLRAGGVLSGTGWHL